MTRTARFGGLMRSGRLRRWLIRLAIALLIIEVFYVVAANYLLRTGMLQNLINKKPEKTSINWDSAATFFPGIATVEGFTLRSQTQKDQIYLRVNKARARISLHKLALKTIHIRGVEAEDAEFRYRERLDAPKRLAEGVDPTVPPPGFEFWPEIPGLSNPPDPKPEELYPPKKKKHPWTIKITGAHVEGPIRVAFNDFNLEADGWAGGGVTVKPRETITIHRGKLGLESIRVTFGEEVVTEDLAIDSNLRFTAFPAKGAVFADVIGGISGKLKVSGTFSERVAVKHEITPGLTTVGAGTVDADLKIKNGVLRAGSTYDLRSDDFQVGIMDLDATGSATVSGGTVKQDGKHVTTAEIVLGDFEFVDPERDTADITGSGLELTASWEGLSLAGHVPASHAEIILERTQIHDISTFNALFPEDRPFFQSGTGVVDARLEVTDQIATGELDLVAEKINIEASGVPLNGDLEVHTRLAEGDLPNKAFDFSGTTIRLDNVVGRDLSEKQEKRLQAWYCEVELQEGKTVFAKPLEANGLVRLKMFDTRPVVALLKQLDAGPKGLSMMPNIKDIDGTMKIDFGKGRVAVDELDLTGKKFETLGWLHIRDKKADGRLFIKYGIIAAGIGLDEGKSKIHLSKPRKWFEDETGTSPRGVQAAD